MVISEQNFVEMITKSLCGCVNGSNARCVSVQTEYLMLLIPYVEIPFAQPHSEM
jgi:hypothetical protein